MRVLVAYTYCDLCNRDGRKVEADEAYTIQFTYEFKPKRLDLCADHRNPTWVELTEYAIDDLEPPRANGKPRRRQATSKPETNGASGTVTCPVCKTGPFDRQRMQGLSGHLKHIHGMDATQRAKVRARLTK